MTNEDQNPKFKRRGFARENYFFALRVPKESWSALELVQGHLPKEGVRYTLTRDFHLTLKFLGPLSEMKAMEAALAVRDWMNSRPLSASIFSLSFEKVGLFFHDRVPGVIWVGLNFPQELFDFQRDLEWLLEPLGFEMEKRFFNPHITLARVKEIQGTMPLNDLVSDFQNLHVQHESFLVDRLDLMKSHLVDGRPPEYELIEIFVF